MALRCQPLSTSGPCPVPHFWCADAFVSWVAYGTVRLHARSHARGLRVLTWSSTDHSIVIGDSPTWSLSFHKRKVGLRTRLVTRRQSHKSNLEPHSGLVQAQPAGIYSIFLQVHVGAVHPSRPPYTLHHQDPDLDRPVAHFWLTSRHLLVYSPDARTLFHPHVLSLPMTTVWELCKPS